jgi:hypothetical protein
MIEFFISMQGTLALEHALSSGSPIRSEVELLRKSVEGIDKDSLLELALSSLPEDVLDYGSDTMMGLKQKVCSFFVCENKWYVLCDAMEMNASVHTLIVYVTLHQNVKLFLCKTASLLF